MQGEVDDILDDLWMWAEGLRRCVVTDGPARSGAAASIADDVTRGVVAGLLAPVAEVLVRAANEGDRTMPAAVRDLFGLP